MSEETTITPGRLAAIEALQSAVAGRFAVGDVLGAALDILTGIICLSCRTREEAASLIETTKTDLERSVDFNWDATAPERHSFLRGEGKTRS